MWAKTVVAIVTMIVAAGSMWRWAPIAQGQAPSCLVATAQGDVQGIDRGEVCEFRGVPFAAPPLGPLRWKPPVAASPWAPVVLDATIIPPSCRLFNQAGMPAGNEDCLKLNIWAPHAASRRPLPVIVWLHPGSFIAASANTATWNGQLFVEETNAIVVTPNYRLGPFGFLGHRALRSENADYPSAGNYGLLDQRLALEWVRAHIASFGGDPNRITIAGQSAGGLSVSLHLVSPRSHWLFDRAIMQGGFASYRWRTREDAEAQGDEFATALGCGADPTVVLTCLRAKTPEEVLRALPTGTEQFAETGRTHWGPVVDGLEIPDQPRTLFEIGAFNRVPIIIGSNRDEGWTWVSRSFPGVMTDAQYESALETEFGVDAQAIMAAYPYPTAENDSAKDTLAQIVTDAEYACGAARLAGLIERTGTPVYLYSFDYAVEAVAPDRAVHGLDVNFVFSTPIGPPLTPTLIPLNSDDLELARSIAGYWKRFAETGNPNRTKQARGRSDWSSATEDTEAAVHWPAFNRPTGKGRGADKYLILDLPIEADKRLREAQCAFWEPFFFRSITAAVPAHTP